MPVQRLPNVFTQCGRRQKLLGCYLPQHMSFVAIDVEAFMIEAAQSTIPEAEH